MPEPSGAHRVPGDLRLGFAGTPEFAVASLRALVESGRSPVAVLTQPDRPAGRGKQLTASPVKQYAGQQGIPVLQPATLRDDDMVAQLAALEPDVLIVAAYGLILPQAVLDAYGLETLAFGPEYIIPSPFDPRLRELVSAAVASAVVQPAPL